MMSKSFEQVLNTIMLFLNKHKSTLIKISKAIGVLVLVLFICFFIFRNTLLNYMLDKQLKHFSEKYEVSLVVEEASFSGLKSVVVKNVSVAKNVEAEKLLHIGSVSASVSLLELLKTHVRFTSLEIDTFNVFVFKQDDQDNFSFLLKSNEQKQEKNSSSINYGETLDNLLNLAFDVVPSDFAIREVNLKLQYDSLNLVVSTPKFVIQDQHYHSELMLVENADTTLWNVEGVINSSKKNAQAKLYARHNGSLFPLVNQEYNLKLSCDTIFFSLDKVEFKHDKLQLSGAAQLNNFAIDHWRISPKTVELKKLSVDYQVTIGNDYFQLDSNSLVKLNKIDFNPYLKVVFANNKKFALKLNTPKMEAQDFFESLPTGLFNTIDGIKASGYLQYHLNFDFDTLQPDSLVFSSTLKPEKFKISSYGETNLSKMNDEFTYTVYEGDRMMRSFAVGPSNPYFTPLSNISIYFQNALMLSEDGNFYYHKGFNERRFGESIAENYKQKRFVRGASTISMQLVKNVFLRRNKTVARKLEEAMIVWLIENNRLTSKARMYEVYLNVIEFGPNVYGIGEASNFYFNKKPADLTIEESIFLAMIVPRPKWFMYHFNDQGLLKENTQGYFNLISGHLLSKGIITPEQQQTTVSKVVLAPLAKSYVVKNDTIVPDEVKEEMLQLEVE